MPCVWYVRGSTEITGPTVKMGRGELMSASSNDLKKKAPYHRRWLSSGAVGLGTIPDKKNINLFPTA